MERLKTFFLIEKWALLYILLISILASIHKGLIAEGETGNLHLYLSSFERLFHHLNPYFMDEELKIVTDFKYAPFFGFIMAPFSFLPFWLYCITWNLFTFLCLYFAVRTLEVDSQKRALFLWLVHIELLTAFQNFQVNPLIVGLMILQLAFHERGRPTWAAFASALSFHTKIFGTICVPFFLFFKRKWTYLACLLIFMALFFSAPLLIDGLEFTQFVYRSWIVALTGNVQVVLAEHSLYGLLVNLGLNVLPMNLTHFIFVFVSVVPFLLMSFGSPTSFQRRQLLYGILLTSVLFNHTSESPTYIIAVSGAALWFLDSKKSRLHQVLIFLVFIATLSPTVWVPELPKRLYGPIKFIPCFLVWIAVYWTIYCEVFRRLFGYSGTRIRAQIKGEV